MFDTLRRVFEAHGFVPIQTPSFENLSTLTGKYGEEGDQLIFKILNNGDFLAKADATAMDQLDSKALVPSISKKALRYDLTVPFARFVVMNRNELTFPFKRYQIQNVWRGDRPGKGRYQEFTQCDCDIIGSESTLCELELVQVFSEGLSALHVPGFKIHINDRRLLQAIAESGGISESQFGDWTVAVDKLDKIGLEGVVREFEERNLPTSAANQFESLVQMRSLASNEAKLDALGEFVRGSSGAEHVLEEIKCLLERAAATGVAREAMVVDPLLARGLDYYTGAIFEVVVENSPVGSICGGGRYDDLTGIFGWQGMSGVGISFGADRIEDVLNHFDAWPSLALSGLDVLVVRMESDEPAAELQTAQALRNAGCTVEVYPDGAKLKKQLKYANDRGARWVVILGEEERTKGQVVLKNMDDGRQSALSLADAIESIQSVRDSHG